MRSVRVIVLVLGLATVALLTTVWPSLVLAAWIADLAHPLVVRLQRALKGRRRAAGMITVVVVLAALTPLVAAFVTVGHGVRDLVERFGAGALGHDGKLADVGDGATTFSVNGQAALDLLKQHGASMWSVVVRVATASAGVVFGALVFVAALYALSVDGKTLYLYIARTRVIDVRTLGRLFRAFRETGRGVLVGMGGTALAQGIVAAIVYASLGVKGALTLGLLTGACSFVPAIGTMLVWGPVAASLAIGGHPIRAIVLVALGIGVISMIDNLLRPWLARVGRLKIPTIVVFVSMIAGLRLVGASGILLGPLVVRLVIEALAIYRQKTSLSRVHPSLESSREREGEREGERKREDEREKRFDPAVLLPGFTDLVRK